MASSYKVLPRTCKKPSTLITGATLQLNFVLAAHWARGDDVVAKELQAV
ncbi:hypothetical protein J4377_07105 [Halomonas sp. XH26]|nr:hypothetical protein [Halomonas sp. XH26]UTA81229.1 hypothetical protein J4377_07105 [Halomonas sp. XH26]